MADLAFWMVAIPFCVLAISVIARLAAWPRLDIIETHETTVRIVVALCCTGAFFLLLAVLGALVAVKAWTDKRWLGLLLAGPLAVVMTFPLLYAILAYARLPNILSRASEAILPPDDALQNQVIDAARMLGLRMTPDLRLAACRRHYYGPVLFGRWGSRPTLVLPHDFSSAVRDVAGGDDMAADVLFKFVILHELSHVKNSDYQFMSWVASIAPALRRWLPLLIVTILAYSAFSGLAAGLALVAGFFWVSACLGVLFWVTYRSIQNHREYLADARAASCMSPDELATLIRSRSCSLSLLESLLVYVGIRRRVFAPSGSTCWPWTQRLSTFLRRSTRFVHGYLAGRLTCLQRISILLGQFFPTHPSSRQRESALAAKRFLSEGKSQLSYASVMLAFPATGLAFLMILCTLLAPAAVLDLPQPATFMMAAFGVLHASWFTLAVLISLPFRNAAGSTATFTSIAKGILARCLVGGASLVVVIALMSLPAAIADPRQYFRWLSFLAQLSLLYVAGSFLIALILTLLIRSTAVFRASLLRGPRHLFLSCAPLIPAFCLILAIGYLVFGLFASHTLRLNSMVWALLGFLWALVPAAVATVLFTKYCLRTRSDVLSLPGELAKHTSAVTVVLLLCFALLAVPSALLASMAYHSIGSIPGLPIDLAALGAVLVTVVLAYVFACSNLRGRELGTPWLAQLALLSNRLGLAASSSFICLLFHRIEKCYGQTGGYGFEATALPDLEATRHCVRSLEVVGALSRVSSDTSQWIMSHLITSATFARRQHGRPSIGATYAALDSLRALGTLPSEIQADTISRWIVRRQGLSAGFADTEPARGGSSLKSTFEALASLAWINRVELVDEDAAADFVVGEWSRSSRMVSDTEYATKALSIIRRLEGSIQRQLRMWVRATKPWVLTLRTDRDPSLVNAFLNVAELVMDQGNEELEEIKAILASRIRSVLEKYDGPEWHAR